MIDTEYPSRNDALISLLLKLQFHVSDSEMFRIILIQFCQRLECVEFRLEA